MGIDLIESVRYAYRVSKNLRLEWFQHDSQPELATSVVPLQNVRSKKLSGKV